MSLNVRIVFGQQVNNLPEEEPFSTRISRHGTVLRVIVFVQNIAKIGEGVNGAAILASTPEIPGLAGIREHLSQNNLEELRPSAGLSGPPSFARHVHRGALGFSSRPKGAYAMTGIQEFDPYRHITDDADVTAYMEACIDADNGDGRLVIQAILDISATIDTFPPLQPPRIVWH